MANSMYFFIFARVEIIRAVRERQKDGSQPIKRRRIPSTAKSSYMPERFNGVSKIQARQKERIPNAKRMSGIKQRIFSVFIHSTSAY